MTVRGRAEGTRAASRGLVKRFNNMLIIYIINQYPKISHTFIRREILALEASGVRVIRCTIRPSREGDSVDASDTREREVTRAILGRGALLRLAAAILCEVASNPARFAGAAAMSLKLARRSERGTIAHLAYLAEACVLKRIAAEAGAAHIHVHFGTNPAAVALLCRLLGGPPYSVTVHGPEEFNAPRALSLGEKVRHAAFVAAISEFTRGQLYRWADTADWAKIHVIRCGLDASYLGGPPPPLALDSRLFVCVGRLAEQKGHLVLIEAAARLAAAGRDFEVAIIGDGPLRAQIERRVEELGLGDKVRLLGWRDDDGVRDEILRSRALVLPSFAEGLPVVLMEALALGRPAIATYVAGIPELVEPGVNGWLVPAGSVEALANAMTDCLEAPPCKLIPMGLKGREAVSGRHDIASEARKLSLLFDLT
jgi:colanic acid/amylovoran biosynthesis glycosyltransferase